MKKKSIYIIALLLIAFAFLMPSDVLAKGKRLEHVLIAWMLIL